MRIYYLFPYKLHYFFHKIIFFGLPLIKFKIFSFHTYGRQLLTFLKSQKRKREKKINVVSSKLIHIQRLDCYAVFNAIHHSWREGEGSVRIGFKLRGTWYKIPFVVCMEHSYYCFRKSAIDKNLSMKKIR